jgi:hypothetical protein
LAQIAEGAESIEDFGRLLRDWLHELRRVSSRPQVDAAIGGRPRLLRNCFAGGAVADAWLAARARVAPEPWFSKESAGIKSRGFALQQAPMPFKRRNLYTPSVDLPLRLHAGRPSKSLEEKRRSNAERQRRFRDRRRSELATLRTHLLEMPLGIP